MDVGFTILYIFLDLLVQKNEYLQFIELTKQAALSFGVGKENVNILLIWNWLGFLDKSCFQTAKQSYLHIFWKKT